MSACQTNGRVTRIECSLQKKNKQIDNNYHEIERELTLTGLQIYILIGCDFFQLVKIISGGYVKIISVPEILGYYIRNIISFDFTKKSGFFLSW